MKSINKHKVMDEFTYKGKTLGTTYIDYISYYNELVIEKEIGLLGNECRFIAKLFTSFQTEVSIN